ncbi:SULT1C2 [Branchiostoma lanceolatum]|uniref:Sulfotransferase n=1 Tax=Branchiostoma lanceolatum TaxID=7740 RepID=A0A8J9Z226_BRALA|nr:SULT1C2 [Branchiostoma lanceolatum]
MYLQRGLATVQTQSFCFSLVSMGAVMLVCDVMCRPPLVFLLFHTQVKVLVPMRNPKDTAVSLYHYAHNMWKLRDFKVTIPWEQFAQNFINGNVPYGDYCDHLLGWWQMCDDPHFLFLKYEDMKRDLLSAVKTIVAFLDVELEESALTAVAEACTFDNMKTEMANSEIPEIRMLPRKGIVGDWKNMFSPEQNKAFDTWYEKKLGGTGITFDFE